MTMPAETLNTTVTTLGDARIPSPVHKRVHGTNGFGFVSEEDRVLIDVTVNRACKPLADGTLPPSYELAGPRERIYFGRIGVRILSLGPSEAGGEPGQ